MSRVPILIIGAEPNGLVLALRLAHCDVPFRIIDRNSGPGQASQAMMVQARTLKFYRQLGLPDAIIARGIRVENAHVLKHGNNVAAISWHGPGVAINPYRFVLSFPKDDHERFIVDQFATHGVIVEGNTLLQSFEQDDSSVRAVLKHEAMAEQDRAELRSFAATSDWSLRQTRC